MPADVETMFYAGQVPWHGVGVPLAGEANSEQAMRLAQMDWDVETAHIVTNDQKKTAVDDYRITRRVQDNAVLGVVKAGFKPIQNRDAFRLFDSIVGQGKAVYHTAGALQGGSKVWILSKLPGVMQIGKGVGTVDEIERYLLLSNSHDGTRPLQMLFTPVRVVCSNTLGLALNTKGSEDSVTKLAPRVTIRHTAKAQAQMKEAGRLMGSALRYYEKFGDFANFLYTKQLRTVQVVNIVSEVFPPNKQREVTPNIAAHRLEVERLFVEGKGHTDIAGSAWALLNAFAEYADHSWANKAMKKSKEPADRAYSIWMGGAKGLKQRASKVISETTM